MEVNLRDLFLLLMLFQVKHFVADYLLQTRYMLGKFKSGWEFFPPLLLHASVHALVTLTICWYWGAPPWLCLVDLVSHFVMDRIKAGPRWLGRFNNTRTHEFWVILGFDQMVHHLIHYLIIVQIVMGARG